MSVSEAVRDLVDDTVESSALVPRNGFHLEPRCRVCRNDHVRKKVNDLLAAGTSYAQIVRALAADNAELDKCDRVTVDSVRTHTTKHFPVQQTAHATYREILERRARENQIDFVQGVATALTPFAYFEVVMNKAFRALVDDGTEVSVETGLRAAEKLQSVLDGRERGTEVLKLKVQLGWIRTRSSRQSRRRCGARSSRSWRSLSSTIWRRSTSARTPSMTLTTSPTTRPSSSTMTTTSFDLRSARRHRGRWGPLPVWTGRSRSCGPGVGRLSNCHRETGIKYEEIDLPPFLS